MYLGLFEKLEDVFYEFNEQVDTSVEVLLAWYGQEDWEGDAFVLYRQDGKLYEVHGGHCSCYGLEGQWDPEETDVATLRHRMMNGRLGLYYSDAGKVKAALSEILDQLEE
jgi:hypothetical protein